MQIKRLFKMITISIAAIGLLFVRGEEVCAQESFIQNDICYEVTGNGTVEADDLTAEFNEKILTIPSTVTYNNQIYTVTSVNMDHLSRYYRMVEEMVVPATVTEQVVVARTDYARYMEMVAEGGNFFDTEDEFLDSIRGDEPTETDGEYWESNHLDYQAFPALKKVRFLGETAPKRIQIEKYLYGEDLYYEVPGGKIDFYKACAGDVYVFFYAGYSGSEDDNTYKTRTVSPVIMSQDGSVPEVNLFSTSKGDYLVKEKAGDGVGKVVLLHAITRDSHHIYSEYTVESKVTNGNYSYEVDEIETAALTAVRTMVLTIPDTVTTLNTGSITPFATCIFLSKNCKEVPGSLIEFNDSDEGTPFVYATGLKKIGKNDPFFMNGTLIVSKTAKVKNAKKNYENLVRVTPVKKGSAIKAAKEVSLKANESKSIKASFKSKTKEHLKYVLLDFETLNPNGENEYVKLSANGKITAKKAGVAYVLVYSLESGKHKVVKVTVKKKTFKKGIYTYAINDSEEGKHTVTIRKCTPGKNKKTLVLPSKVTYKGITYTVTGAYAEEFIDENSMEYNDVMSFYPNPKPIISNKVAKKSKIKKIVVPATMTDVVFLTSKLPKLTKIEFKGKKLPKHISIWGETESQVKIYVPKKKLGKYRNRIYAYGKNWNRFEVKKYAGKYIKGY